MNKHSLLWQSIPEWEDRGGTLYLDGISSRDLIKEFGSPLYVYSENRIRHNYRKLVKAYQKYYVNFSAYYAIKANNNPAIVKILAEEGAGADCSCVPEILIAQKIGMPADKILYSGVYNSDKELLFALDNHVRLNLEDTSQLRRIPQNKVPEFLCFRVNPGIGSSGKEGLIFAGKNAKFGIIESDIRGAYAMAKDLGVKRFGIHMMTGSNILTHHYFKKIVQILLDLAGPIAKELGITFEFIDIGGSLGIPYHRQEKPLDIDLVAREVVSVLEKKLEQYHLGKPLLIHEPGRYLLGDAGVLLTSITSIKKAHKTFIGVDAGMHTLLRPALYDSYHHIFAAEKLHYPLNNKVNIVGQICENTDQFAKDRLMPSSLKVHDILAIMDVGAYGFCMASQYNTKPRPAEVLIKDGQAYLIRQRETFEDLIEKVMIPEHLKPR